MIGVYKFTNIVTGKVYIGSSSNIIRRYEEHLNTLIGNRSPLIKLQNSFNKYKLSNFTFSIQEIVKEIEDLLDREKYWIDFYDCTNQEKGYNIRTIPNSNLGFRHSEESKAKISSSLIGRVCSKETRRKISNSHKGTKKSSEAREKMSKAAKGRPSGHRRAILQISLENFSLVGEYDSIYEAAYKNNISRNGILAVLRGRKTEYKDYFWEYKEK